MHTQNPFHWSLPHESPVCPDERGVQTKMGIDATLNEESRCLERVRYPKVDLKDYQ